MRFLDRFSGVWVGLALAGVSAFAGNWEVKEGVNPLGPGSVVDVRVDGRPVARLVHGEGQMKPFLHLFGTDGELLTNPGLDLEGKPAGLFNHHRGIFIGWNRVSSELGKYDLWHRSGFPGQGEFDIVSLETATGRDSATIVALIKWRAAQRDAAGSDVMLDERRTFHISRPGGEVTQVDARFELEAVREVSLNGDLQHAGVHFRASNEVAQRKTETSYLWEPDLPAGKGRIVSDDLKWSRLLFPIGERWYAAQQINAPGNPVTELSWRDYGRFGYFFKRALKKGDKLDLRFRFVIWETAEPAQKPKQSAAQIAESRRRCQGHFESFVKFLEK